MDGFNGSRLNVIWRVKVWLTGTQANYVVASGAQFGGFVGNG